MFHFPRGDPRRKVPVQGARLEAGVLTAAPSWLPWIKGDVQSLLLDPVACKSVTAVRMCVHGTSAHRLVSRRRWVWESCGGAHADVEELYAHVAQVLQDCVTRGRDGVVMPEVYLDLGDTDWSRLEKFMTLLAPCAALVRLVVPMSKVPESAVRHLAAFANVVLESDSSRKPVWLRFGRRDKFTTDIAGGTFDNFYPLLVDDPVWLNL